MTLTPGTPYVVTKGTRCRTLQRGDHVTLLADGCLMLREAQVWLEPEDAADMMQRATFAVDTETIERRIAKLKAQIAELEAMT